VEEVVGERLEERRERRAARDPDRELVDLLEPLRVDRADEERADGRRLGVEDATEHVDDVVGGDGPAVVEGETVLETDDPLRRVLLGRRHLLGQPERGLGVEVEAHEAVVQLRDAREVHPGDPVQGVDRVGRAAAREAAAQGPSGLRGRGGGGGRALRRRRGVTSTCGEQRARTYSGRAEHAELRHVPTGQVGATLQLGHPALLLVDGCAQASAARSHADV
jgi:hypothetical protein